jgi:MFS family permease
VFHDHDRSLLYLLATIFCLFLAYSALTVFFTSYAIINLQVPRGQEAQLLAFWALAIVGFAIPGGLLASRIGRKHTVLLGIVIFTVATAPIALLTALPMIRGLLIMSGLGWALIVVNAFPMVLDSAAPERLVGTYTGMYFLATQLAEVVGPLLVGGFLDLTGRDYRLIFLYTLIVMLLAGGLLLRVHGGEARGELDR